VYLVQLYQVHRRICHGGPGSRCIVHDGLTDRHTVRHVPIVKSGRNHYNQSIITLLLCGCKQPPTNGPTDRINIKLDNNFDTSPEPLLWYVKQQNGSPDHRPQFLSIHHSHESPIACASVRRRDCIDVLELLAPYSTIETFTSKS
jgi:hypothetical protein